VDYLDANWPEHPLTPADAGLAAQAREWERLADEDIGPAVRRICYDVLLGHPRLVLPLLTEGCAWYGRVLLPLIFPRLRARMRALLKIHPAGVAASVATLDAALERVNARWAETGYLVGDRFTRADLAVAALLAPLFMPSVYGVPWPRALPADLAELLERYREPVRRAARLYARHRLLVAPDPD
jgi:glutathione S-transferase